ncbi:MAG TPA: chitinase [Bacteroidales bacterium]|nr:MAG: hypothetical protein A2X11_10250 [Bacteroidetes bacterium GWE2_42_24]OFY25892.1 MAG: hypothetical protein A2X09_09625 [Bacteroidetes bacterium GWF2_43_11]HBZ67601.1 chitinase [Bacteroidales bacterium]
MKIDETKLRQMIPGATDDQIKKFIEPLTECLERFQIDSPIRIACFIAQITHESGSLKYVRELACGKAYEGRTDLGNTQPGDGDRFKGRGLIQVTGRDNYTALKRDLKINCVDEPDLLERPYWAAMTAGWFWNLKGLNRYADIGDMRAITRRINGGLTGFDDRMNHFRRCKFVLEV